MIYIVIVIYNLSYRDIRFWYIEFVRYIAKLFISDTVRSNTIDIGYTVVWYERIWKIEDTDGTAAEKVYTIICSKRVTRFIWRALKTVLFIFDNFV